MGIRFWCPNGHKLNVKNFQAGRVGICPFCGAKFVIPHKSTRPSSKEAGATEQTLETAPTGSTEGLRPLWSPASSPATALPPQGAAPLAQPSMPAGGQPQHPARPLPQSVPQPQPASPLQPLSARPASAHPQEGLPLPQAAPLATTPAPAIAPLAAAPLGDQFHASAPPPEPPSALPTDPLAEAPEAVWYVRPPTGGQYGPASAEVMRAWVDEGRVSAETLVWREGWRDWQEAGQVFAQLGAGQELLALASGPARAGGKVVSVGERIKTNRQSRNLQFVLMFVLALAVIVLAVVFFWVLNQSPAAPAQPGGSGAGVTPPAGQTSLESSLSWNPHGLS